MEEININIPELTRTKSGLFIDDQPKDKYIKYLLKTTFVSYLTSKNKYINYSTYIILNLILLGSLFCILWYPTYYLNQPIIWTFDLVIVFVTYNYLYFLLQYNEQPIDNYDIVLWKRNVNLFFYSIFMVYWFYFAIIQFYTHSEPNVLIQLGNIYMSFSWYMFFSTVALLYYYICNRLLQRSEELKNWLKGLKKKYRNQSVRLIHYDSDFYKEYNSHYSIIKNFAKYWNFLIFIGFILLIAHIPIDLIAIISLKAYYDIPGLIIKTSALGWYLYCICQLNDYEDKIIPYLYKHRIYNDDQIEYISKYIKCRPLGLNFYGIKISGTYISRYLIIIINLLIPAIYTLFSKNIEIL
jgi:hypothetical protein